MTNERVLLTGATGFLGGRLLAKLMERGARVRAVSRRTRAEAGLGYGDALEFVRGDVREPGDLERMMEGVDVAYYMVHSMEGGVGEEDAFVERDREAAMAFGRAAAAAGVGRIIYVSGLQPDEPVSKHLSSRNDVERYLGYMDVPVTTLRAGFIIGPGSAGFQMLKGLVGQLTLMLIPPRVYHETQPAFAEDVVDALLYCLEHPEVTRGQTFDVGSVETVRYVDLVREYCLCDGREMRFVDVPWVPVELSAVYVSAVSQVPYALIVALSAGLCTNLYVKNERLYELAPELGRTPPLEAMRLAYAELEGRPRDAVA